MADDGATGKNQLETAVVQGVQCNLGFKGCRPVQNISSTMDFIHLLIFVSTLTIRVACGVIIPDKFHQYHNDLASR